MPRLAAAFIGVWTMLAAAGGTASEQDGVTGNPGPPLSPPTAVESDRGHVGWQGADRGVRDEPQYDFARNPGIGAPKHQGGQAVPAGASDELLRLQDVLDTRGWLLRRDSAGNMYLLPKAAASAPESVVAESSSAVAPGAADLHPLQELLDPAHWRVAQDSAGNIFLFPSPRGSDALPSHRDEASPAPREAVVEPRPAPPPAADPDRAHEPGAGGPTVIGFEDVRALLATRGWKLETDPAGNWLLTPRGEPEPQSASSAAAKDSRAEASGKTLGPAPSGTVTQPVHRQADAVTRAEEWLARTGKTGLAVGAVRRIHKVFLVSIVGEGPPHRLQNQLAIRVEDGLVVPLLGD